MQNKKPDGIHAVVPREHMTAAARKLRDIYDLRPGAPLYRREFYIWEEAIARWKTEGMPADADHAELFQFDPPGKHALFGLGWCEAAFIPPFESRLIEDRGETEVVQDAAGRHVLYFKGRRHGFMPEYIAHPVKDEKTWVEDVKWRMTPATPERVATCARDGAAAASAAGDGVLITQHLIGGYMYLRSLIGPETLLYAFYDMPDVVHDCMRTWLELADAVIAHHQRHVTLDEIFLAEDICYNHGALISPDMMKEFLLPYYQQLIANVKARQIDRARHLFVQIDTDGYADPVIPIYRESIGMDVMSPFEVASHCDVVATRKQYPDLVISGGIDKRVLAQGKQEIDRMLERIIPVMRERGGYIPTCDHGVPVDVSYENYLHYRRRCVELGG